MRESPAGARAAPRRAAAVPAAKARTASRKSPHATPRATPQGTSVRAVRRADLDAVIALDASVTGLEKRKYWERIYRRYGMAAAPR